MKKVLFYFSTIISTIALAAILCAFLYDNNAPKISILPEVELLNQNTELLINITDKSPLESIIIKIIQNKKTVYSFSKKNILKNSFKLSIPLKDYPLEQGEISLHVTAQDTSYYPIGHKGFTRINNKYLLDITAPTVHLFKKNPQIIQGNATILQFSASKDTKEAYVRVNDEAYPAFLQENGLYLLILPQHWLLSPKEFKPKLYAVDNAGNTSITDLLIPSQATTFPPDKIFVTNKFLNKKMPDFIKRFPTGTEYLEMYLILNGHTRAENRETLKKLSEQTATSPLWEGTFMPLPNHNIRGYFADTRSYFFEEKIIDKQRHLGLDLVSIKNADIPAANSGKVIYAGDLGIYGNTVVIDHGLGLQTLYGHMSKMLTKVGDTVERGALIGKTGISGLTGGDHVHFEIIVHGVAIDPTTWWDKAWLRQYMRYEK